MASAGPVLEADCASCVAWCCVALPFATSADFPVDKPAGRPCRHLDDGNRCGIHDALPARGYRGCVAFDCFGAGQRVTLLTAATGGWRSEDAERAFAAFDRMRTLHELLWYLDEVIERIPDDAARAARVRVSALAAAPLSDVLSSDVQALRADVAVLLRAASQRVRHPRHGRFAAGADLAGADLRGADLTDEDLRSALLIGADLAGATLRRTDLLGADLRGADLSGADLQDALFVTRSQIGSARADVTTRLPSRMA